MEIGDSIILSDDDSPPAIEESKLKSFSTGKERASNRLVRMKCQTTSSTKRKADWISSSFGNFGQNPNAKISDFNKFAHKVSGEGHKHHVLQETPNSTVAEFSWIDRYRPTKETDLAVHKKKIFEVKQWLVKRLTSLEKKDFGNILVLTGPAGTGKTTTIDVLSKELNVELQEWNSPMSLTNEEYCSWKDFRVLSTESQRKQFHDFLLRANKYPTLLLTKQQQNSNKEGKKIILVEDIPNVFHKNVRDFHEILRQFQSHSRSPLIFVLSDNYIGDSSLHTLFPKKIQLELQITCIGFNAVAMTSLTKTLSKIASQESRLGLANFNMPSKDTLDLLATSCSGDIRACINSLQFFCTNKCQTKKQHTDASSRKALNSKMKKIKSSRDETVKTNASSILLCGKDTSLFLFRSLGKILYCKREVLSTEEKIKQLPNRLQNNTRDKLLIDPEAIIEKTHVTSDTLMLYLHQNYLPFFSDIDDAFNAISYLSDADYVTGLWSSREVMKDYSGSLATRGLIFANKQKQMAERAGGWRPLHKPKWFETFKETNVNKKAANELFHDLRHPAVELYLDVLPYYGRTNVCLRTPSHISFVEMISRFDLNTHKVRHSVSLDQLSDCAIEAEDSLIPEAKSELLLLEKNGDDQPASLSQVIANNRTFENEADTYEENLIEDFSDEDDLFFL